MKININKSKITYIKGIIKLIAFLLILFIVLQTVHNITKRKYSYEKMKDFFDQKEDFDVLFFGSSHLLNGVFPMQLWKDYGIVSYNLGNSSERVAITYYNMLLALKETKPKLIVIDLNATDDLKVNTNRLRHINNGFDAYPLSYTKYLAIKDLLGTENLMNNTMEFLFNFSTYHSRWSIIDEDDFEIKEKYEKGAVSVIDIANLKNTSDFDSIDMYNDKENINMQYLRKIIEHCQQNEIKVLATYLPFIAKDSEIAISKYIRKICDKYNVDYLNFLNMDVANFNIDFFDASHLNPSGARKITDYIGKYITENYDIPDQRNNEDYSFWYEDYNEYVDFKINNLKENKKKLKNYLMLLYGEEDIKYEIKIATKEVIKKDSTLYYLLENLENNYEIDGETFKNKKDKTVKITTWDNRTGKLIDTLWW